MGCLLCPGRGKVLLPEEMPMADLDHPTSSSQHPATLTKGFVCRNWCRRGTAGYTDDGCLGFWGALRALKIHNIWNTVTGLWGMGKRESMARAA